MAKTYEKAGVNLEAGYEVVRRIKQHVASTARTGSMGNIGSFGGMFDLSALNVKEPVLVSGTDGVGTKLKIAFAMDKHDTIGIDAVAMCVNDVLAQGAEPLFFLDYVALGHNIPEKVEAIVAGDAHTLLNIRRARYTLDQTLLGKWPFLTDAERKAVGGLDKVIARIEQTIVDDQNDFFRGDPASVEKQKRLAWYHEGIDPVIALARGGKPLPPELAARNAIRMLPRRNKSGLDKDPDTPFGFSVKLDFPEGNEWFFIRSHEPARDPRWASVAMPRRFGPEEWRDRLDGKYRYLHLGRMPVGHADSLLICGSRGSLRTNFCLTPLFDPKRPKRLYDFYVLIAFGPDKSHIRIAEVVAIPTDEDAKDEKPQKRDAAKDQFDALV